MENAGVNPPPPPPPAGAEIDQKAGAKSFSGWAHAEVSNLCSFGLTIKLLLKQLTKLCDTISAHLTLSPEDLQEIEDAKSQLQRILDKRDVRVVQLSGEETEIRIHTSASVADLKKGIQQVLGTDTFSQQLVLPDQDEALEDSELLQENGIFDDGACVTLLIRASSVWTYRQNTTFIGYRIREKPTFQSNVICTMNQGDCFQVFETDPGCGPGELWLNVVYVEKNQNRNDTIREGWSAKNCPNSTGEMQQFLFPQNHE
jgi:hypothetical protein